MQPELSAAARRILDTVAKVPPGRVATYGQVAAMAGLLRRARLVGTTLRQVGEAKLPWHRILRADGKIAFAPGSAPFDEQTRRLKREGVAVRAGRVDLATYGWRRDRGLDEVLWGPDAFAPPGMQRAKPAKPKPATSKLAKPKPTSPKPATARSASSNPAKPKPAAARPARSKPAKKASGAGTTRRR